MKVRKVILAIALAVAAVMPLGAWGRGRAMNDQILNRPYSDMRPWHLGFSVGAFAQGIGFTHNGFVTDEGQTWFMDQPSYSPGFCVNGLVDLRLGSYFNLRFTPGMYFGNREVKMLDTTGGATASQNIKSAFVVIPVDLKYSALRYRNSRPYVTMGVMPAFDVGKKRSDYIKTKPMDFYLTFGLGCDFYLPYFKFIPEIKFCLGLNDTLVKDRPDLADDPGMLNITRSLSKATTKMFVLTFYFE